MGRKSTKWAMYLIFFVFMLSSRLSFSNVSFLVLGPFVKHPLFFYFFNLLLVFQCLAFFLSSHFLVGVPHFFVKFPSFLQVCCIFVFFFLWKFLFRVVTLFRTGCRYTMKISVLKSWSGCAVGVSQGSILGRKALNITILVLFLYFMEVFNQGRFLAQNVLHIRCEDLFWNCNVDLPWESLEVRTSVLSHQI